MLSHCFANTENYRKNKGYLIRSQRFALLLFVSLCVHLALPAATLTTTVHETRSTCFSHFKNASQTFIALGEQARLDAAINLADKRGYSWRQFPVHFQFQRQLQKIPGTSVFVFERHATPGHSAHFFPFFRTTPGTSGFYGNILGDSLNTDVDAVIALLNHFF